jgi:hypothetical protein
MNLASALKIKSFATDSGSTDSSSNNFGQSFSDPNTAPLLNIGGQTEQNPATGPGQSVDLSSGISPVTVPGSNFVFNNTWGAGVTAAFQSAVISAEQYLERLFPNACTVNCTFNLQNLNNPNASAENSFSPIHVTYSNFVTALQQHAKTAAGRVAAAALAKLSDPTGGTGVQVSIGEARILGLAAAGTVGGPTDDTVTLNSQYWTAANITSSPGDVMAVMEHELSEGIMGRVGGLGQYGHSWAPMDFFRFTAGGQRDYTGGADGIATYFGLNGSSVYTGLQFHGPYANGTNDGQDTADWNQFGDAANAKDPFGPGGPGVGDPGTLSPTDITILQALGWGTGASASNDFNGDGSSDLLWRNSGTGQVGIWNSNGAGGFTYQIINPGDPTWQIVGTGDFNGIGKDGILWRSTTSGQVGIWNSNGSGGFTYQINSEGDLNWQIQGVGDFNGDGKSDILWTNTNAGLVGLWDSNGSGGFTYQVFNQIDPNWQVQGIGDFNGDGSSDILWRNLNSGLVGLWDSNGSGGFTYQVFGQSDASWQIQGVGDFNGDGKSDILWRNTNSGQVGLWETNNSGGFTYQIFNESDPTWQIQGVGDFNGDGKADILWRNTNSGQIGIWDSNGSGGFTYQIINEGDPTWSTFNGNDTLVASAADTTLYGNPGNTTFAIGPGAGQDKIYNFQNSQDTLQFNHALFANFAAAMTNATQVGANTVFAIDANDSVTLENVNKSSLAASNFRFA